MSKGKATITDAQAARLAAGLLPYIREYIDAHREEFEEWRKQREEVSESEQ